MLRTNLATRPFYNERLAHIVLGVGFALVVALTAYNVTRIIGLSLALVMRLALLGKPREPRPLFFGR